MFWYLAIYAVWSIVGAVWVISRCEHAALAWAWALAMIVCAPLATLLYYLVNVPRENYGESYCHHSYSRLQNAVVTGCGSLLTLHNRVQALHNGDATFASLLRDIQRAQREIDVEYYILSSDRVGRALLRLLERRARAGVKVRILYDSIGSWSLRGVDSGRMVRSGIEIIPHAPLRFPWLVRSLHRRNHRKVVVIDGCIAYLGGINVAWRYLHGGPLGFWRDEHIRIEGAAVQQVRSLFEADWRAAGGTMPMMRAATQHISTICPMQIVWSQEGPSRHAYQRVLMEAVASARHEIRISTPYFLPSRALQEMIISAARSGVKVELLLPRETDVRIVSWAMESYVERCLRAGVAVYRYGGGFLHSKTVSIDDGVAIVGSANIDCRSLCYNMEVAAIIYSRTAVAEYISQFRADVALSEQLSPKMYDHVPFARRLVCGLARLFAPLL